MRKLPSRKLLGAVIAAALLTPNAGFTLGLGEIEVDSALNQKLRAEIELLSAAPEDAETIIVKLASRKQFTRAGIDRPYLLNDLRFQTAVIDGVPHIKVSSRSPIREPFLNFLVEIDWPNGHLLREYTVLLDPPVFMTQPASTALANQGGTPSDAGFRPSTSGSTHVVPVATPGMTASSRPQSSAVAANQAPAQVAPQSTWVPAPVMQQQAFINQPSGSYKIKSGDTAWSLAEAMRPDQSITVPQMMVAMLRANPESFINENINGLKRGYILRVPDYNQITTVSQQEALALVREQAALWRQYQQSNAGGKPVSAMEADDMGSGSAMGEASGQDEAYLEIVSAGSGSSTMSGKDPTQMSARELRAELARAREKVETGLVEKEELQQRVDTLQQHVDKMKGMLSIEDAELAEVQSLGMPTDSEMTDESMTGSEVMESEIDMAEEGMVDMSDEEAIAEAMMDESVEGKAVESEMVDSETGEDALFVDETEVVEETKMEEPVQATSETQVAPQVVASEPADPLTKLLNNPMMLAAAGGGLLLIAALVGLIIKRRKKSGNTDDETEVKNGFDDLESLADDIAEETAGDVVEEVAEEAAEEFDSDSTMILDAAEDTVIAESDESESDEDEPRDDVIAEADVYLAYGIYQQAEELLTQAIADSPDRDDYRVKLAETHYASKDKDAFVKAASDLRSRVEESSPSWKKVAAMGQDLCADNPMFQGSMIGSVTDMESLSAETPEMDFDLGDDDSTGDSTDDSTGDLADESIDISLDDDEPLELPEDSAGELEFDLSETGAEEESTDSDDEFSLDIDASELDIDIEEESADAGDSEEIDLSDLDIGLDDVSGKDDIDIDFGLDDIEGSSEATPTEEEEEVSLDLTDDATVLDMDLGSDEEITAEPVEEVEEPIEVAAIPEPVDDEEDFDLSSLDDVDEISTKLDLARAYLDMGDHEGTKGILEEVLADGNDEQKQEANDLMAKLD